MFKLSEHYKEASGAIKALGAVYGDIGTSPLYTLAVLIVFVPITPYNVIEILSMLVWTLTILVTFQYAWLAMSVSSGGEGGAIVLAKALSHKVKGAKTAAFVSLLSLVSVSLLIGDGVITPAISILSAVEGIKLVPGFNDLGQTVLVGGALSITFALFWVQKRGVENIASAFGPIMLIWFLIVGLIGFWYSLKNPSVFLALNPMYAVMFAIEHPIIAFIMLGDVILCATGGEALYADMGQLGRKPILQGWIFVFIALSLCYLGQGAFVLSSEYKDGLNPLFAMIQGFAPIAYVPFLLLAVLATIIASQAMISGIFSVVYQLINIRAFPRFKVSHTSLEIKSQIYIGFINWALFFCVALMLVIFKTSDSLAAAYGLAVSGAMALTGWFLFFIFLLNVQYVKSAFAFLTAFVSSLFFASCLLKIPEGGYWSLAIASIPFFVVVLYGAGQKRLAKQYVMLDKHDFLERFNEFYKTKHKLDGTAVFFVRTTAHIPYYLSKIIFDNGILYEKTVACLVKNANYPKGISSNVTHLDNGISQLTIEAGYMEVLDIESILRMHHINENIMFYGQEDITSSRLIWKIYAIIKTLAPNFVTFYKLPQEKLVGVLRRFEI